MIKKLLIATLCCWPVGLALAEPVPARNSIKQVWRSAQPRVATRVVSGEISNAPKVSFRNDLIPLFRDNCTMCHQGDIPMGALALTPDVAYENLVNAQAAGAHMLRVEPGRPNRSYLYFKTSGKNALVGGKGIGMPWASTLSPTQVELVRRWITEGALNN